MDANLKARVEATMRIPRVVEDGIVRDLRLLYLYATGLEAEAERLRAEILSILDRGHTAPYDLATDIRAALASKGA